MHTDLLSSQQHSSSELSLDIEGQDWEQGVEVLKLNHMRLADLEGLTGCTNLLKASFIDNEIDSMEGLENCLKLEELSFEGNRLQRIEGISSLINLKKLDLGKNQIFKIQLGHMPNLTQLSLEDNQISHLTGLIDLMNLMELYIGNNKLLSQNEIQVLRINEKLIILDISGNPMSRTKDIREYIIFQLKKLKVLNGLQVESSDIRTAKSLYDGKLTNEILEPILKGVSVTEVRFLDLSHCKLRDFEDTFTGQKYPALEKLVLRDNRFTTLNCFHAMPSLTYLDASKNHIDSLFPVYHDSKRGLAGLWNLQVLDVAENALSELSGIQFAKLTALKHLNAPHNQIKKIENLETLHSLVEVNLGYNKIREISPHSFAANIQLRFLRINNNVVKSLANLSKLSNLSALNMANNKISELFEVEKIADCQNLCELVLSGNFVSQKGIYRLGIIRRMPQLDYLDDLEVSVQEREKIQAATALGEPAMVHSLVGQQRSNAVKVKSHNFDSILPSPRAWESTLPPVPNNPKRTNSQEPAQPTNPLGIFTMPLAAQARIQLNRAGAEAKQFGGGFPSTSKTALMLPSPRAGASHSNSRNRKKK